MEDLEKVYPQGKLCISSVQKKEEGFEDYRYVAYLAATKLGFYAVRNPENRGISQEDFEAILKNDYPVFILLIGRVDSGVVNKEFEKAKQNCLPIFIFMKKYKGEITNETKNIIKKLSSYAYNSQCTTFERCEDLYIEVLSRLQKFITEKALKSPILQKGVGFAYRANEDLMKRAKKQIIIYQKTSILVLGPRSWVTYESLFYRELLDWFMEIGEDVEFLHVFNMRDTINELKQHGEDYDLKLAKENLIQLYESCMRKGSSKKRNIRYSNNPSDVSYVITDTNFVFAIPIEGERYTLELPAYIMKVDEIEKIKEELYLKTDALKLEDIINNIYNL